MTGVIDLLFAGCGGGFQEGPGGLAFLSGSRFGGPLRRRGCRLLAGRKTGYTGQPGKLGDLLADLVGIRISVFPVRVDSPDAHGERRVGGEHAAHGGAEEHVGKIFGARNPYVRPAGKSTDSLERARDAIRVAGKLNGCGIGEKFPLSADRRPDERAEETTDQADHDQPDSNQDKGSSTFVLAPSAVTGAPSCMEHDFADTGEKDYAEQNPRKTDVDAHVSVENVAEFMGHDSLQLVPCQFGRATTGDSDHGVTGGKTGGKGIDAFFLHQVDRWNGRSRSNGHFLHHVENPSLEGISRVG